MSKTTTIQCDIKNCTNTINVKEMKMQVIMMTEQNEGRSTKPYLQDKTIDICEVCMSKILTNGTYIRGYGAMGYNDYCL